jgi:AcrR family transcriptional regulator
MTTASTSRVERKRARNREALVSAARRLFAREGFEATTIAGIAEAADLGFGTFYRYFKDKEAVLEAVLEQGRADIDDVLLAGDNATGPAADALVRLTDRLVRTFVRNRDLMALWWQVAIRDLKLHGIWRENKEVPAALEGALRQIISRGVNSGEFSPGDDAMRARFLASAHLFVIGPAAPVLDEAKIIETLCDFELRALGATSVQTGGR